jgi:hypothetical protein
VSAVRLSKIDYYLADNLCVIMLSEMVGGIQEIKRTNCLASSKSGISHPPGPKTSHVGGREPGNVPSVPRFFPLMRI